MQTSLKKLVLVTVTSLWFTSGIGVAFERRYALRDEVVDPSISVLNNESHSCTVFVHITKSSTNIRYLIGDEVLFHEPFRMWVLPIPVWDTKAVQLRHC